MKISASIFLTLILTFAVISLGNKPAENDEDIHQLWLDCRLKDEIPFKIFDMAISGYRQISNLRKKDIISIIDYSKPSTEKRFFVIDLKNKKLLYTCLVAHGKNSGGNYTKAFSNQSGSLKSPLGFFITAETYSGKNGLSLRLNGIEKSINDNARTREIVIHGAEYVSKDFISRYGRLGRSWGCPALPVELAKEIIERISDGSCLFIYGDDEVYRKTSGYIKKK